MAKRKKQEDLLGMEIPEETDLISDEISPQADLAVSAPVEESFFSAQPAAQPHTENYVVLARRYRPQTFDEIVGQENVQTALRGAIQSGQIAHAFLFSGPRGTGKTSTARILAKALNCQNGGPRPDPCGKCDSCRAIASGSSLDVIEIDAASNTGVDNIRDLRSGVVLAPFSRYKVYIVDEVHMLSMAAFNALLKTLEEPPPQVIFVLATTELQKVPETIVSRCQSFAFRRFTSAEIAGQLGKILDIETKRRNLTVEDEDRSKILDLIARNAEGGMRDAQVALDQVLVLSQGKIELDSVRRFLGQVSFDILDEFVTGLYNRSTEDLLLLIEKLVGSGQDLERFAKSLLDHVRQLLILRTAPDKPELVNFSPDRLASMRKIALELPVSFLLNTASGLLNLCERIKTSTQSRFLLEFTVIRLTQVDVVEDIAQILARLQELESQLAGGGSPPRSGGSPSSVPPSSASRGSGASGSGHPAGGRAGSADQTRPAQHSAAAAEPSAAAPCAASPDAGPAPAQVNSTAGPADIHRILCQSTEAVPELYSLHMTLRDAQVLAFDDKRLVLAFAPADRFGYVLLGRPENQKIVCNIVHEATGRHVALSTEILSATQAQEEHETQSTSAVPAVSCAVPPSGPAVAHAALPQAGQAPEEEPHAPAADENVPDAEPDIYYPPEIWEHTRKDLKGDALMRFLEKHQDVKEVFHNVKEVFKLEDSQVTFRARML